MLLQYKKWLAQVYQEDNLRYDDNDPESSNWIWIGSILNITEDIVIGKMGLKPCPSRAALYSNLAQQARIYAIINSIST